ncbi:hypothetical protein HY642_02655 [Candidatus Woesearchaeota archaeon]|nr:hypothetical protein [Candidatus Woesearchaeota archaeon]
MRVKRFMVRPSSVFYIALILAAAALAAYIVSAQLTNFADPLNYFNERNHTVTVTWSGTSYANVTCYTPVNFTYFGNFTAPDDVNCTATDNEVKCYNLSSTSVRLVFQSNASLPERTLSPLLCNATNGTAFNATPSIKFLRLDDGRVFNTLVEYGRGRGNYFFNSFGGTATSGRVFKGCTYLPNGTGFELNYLHKVYNVMQYYGKPASNGQAVNGSFMCVYNYSSLSRQHLTTGLSLISGLWNANYSIPEIGASWERMGFVSVQYDAGQLAIGSQLQTNCTNLTYYLYDLGGSVVVNKDNFTFEIRDREPFIVNATTNAGFIGNGTQEVLISYNITNQEVYDVTGVSIDIEAPRSARFVGTRGELWGTALDQFHFEKNELLAGQQELITLVARFNTTGEESGQSIALGGSVKIQYITCWEKFAYNPIPYIQRVPVAQNVTLDLTKNSTIVNIPFILLFINSTTVNTLNTVTLINTTVNNIINVSLTINLTLIQLNSTVNSIFNMTINASNQLGGVFGNLTTIIGMLNCSVETTNMCEMLRNISNYLDNINQTVVNINNSISSFNITDSLGVLNRTIIDINNTVTNILTNVTVIFDLTQEIFGLQNCTQITPNSTCFFLNLTQFIIVSINSTVVNMSKLLQFINNTQFGNISTTVLFNLIVNRSNDIDTRLNNITQQLLFLRQFDEELIFLVTDASNSQQSARQELDQNNLPASVDRLKQAQDRLNQAAERLSRLQVSQTEKSSPQTIIVETPTKQVPSKDYVFLLLLLAGIVLLVVYFRRRSQEYGSQGHG